MQLLISRSPVRHPLPELPPTLANSSERAVREASAADDTKKLQSIISQLSRMATDAAANSRSGAIIGLAGVSIALGNRIAEYLHDIVKPILECFGDVDSKVRYFACESMYNVVRSSSLTLVSSKLKASCAGQSSQRRDSRIL